MDKKDTKSARKSRDISTQLEEDNLWDLEDDLGNEEEAPVADEKETVTETEDDDLVQEPKLDPEDTTSDEPEAITDEPARTPAVPSEQTSEKPYAELDTDENAPEEDDMDAELSEGSAEGSLGSDAAPATAALKKLSLKPTEKIALGTLAAVLVGLAIWGCIWLSEKNQIANTRETVELPVTGKHATIIGLETFWITPNKGPGVNLNAMVVPSVTITLDEDKSNDGALRLFFRNTNDDSIGDPITLPFKSGQFSNGSNTIEVAASDGFREEGQFHAYQVDDATPWRIQILEAPSAASPGSDFIDLIDAPVEAKRR